MRRTEKDVRSAVRKELKGVAEPIRSEAETNARRPSPQGIRNIGPDWSRMRTGVTVNSIYVVPALRGVKKGKRKRPNLADLLMDRAMQPALDDHADEIERDFGAALDRVADNFSR